MSARWAAMMPTLAAFGVTLAACSGPTDTVLISSLDVQAAAGTTLTVAVVVEDQFGNHVGCWAQTTICIDPKAPEVQVTFTPSAGGAASPGQTMTYQGEALTGWTIAPGANTLTVTVGTLSATYTATGT